MDQNWLLSTKQRYDELHYETSDELSSSSSQVGVELDFFFFIFLLVFVWTLGFNSVCQNNVPEAQNGAILDSFFTADPRKTRLKIGTETHGWAYEIFICGFSRKPKAPGVSSSSRLLENMLQVPENCGEAAENERAPMDGRLIALLKLAADQSLCSRNIFKSQKSHICMLWEAISMTKQYTTASFQHGKSRSQ